MWIDKENIISKIKKFCCQNNPQSIKSTFKWIKVKGAGGKSKLFSRLFGRLSLFETLGFRELITFYRIESLFIRDFPSKKGIFTGK